MAAGIRPHRALRTVVALALLVAGAVGATPAAVPAADTPRRGGVLLAAIAAEPPGLDSHQESTSANIQLVAPFYSTLLQFDPLSFPKINFEAIVSAPVRFMDDPDVWINRYTTGDTENWGRFSDPRLDDLYARQTRALDPVERKKLVNELDRIVLENAYYLPGLWWTRNVVHWAKVKNYVAPPNYYTNQKLQDVWLSED